MTYRSPTTPYRKFSLAVSGEGRLIPTFIEAVKLEYPGVTLYDRNEEAARPPSPLRVPPHPNVADIDAVFVLSGERETLTLRNRKIHRYFNYVYDPGSVNQADFNRLMKRILATVGELIGDEP
jgi:hypothetical protein